MVKPFYSASGSWIDETIL